MSNSITKNNEIHEEQNVKIFEKLFMIIQNESNIFENDNDEIELTKLEKSKIKLESAIGILKMSTIGEIHKNIIKTKEFLLIGYSIIDERLMIEYRRELSKKLFELLRLNKLPTKFIAILFLSIGDSSSENANLSQLYLKTLINLLRRNITLNEISLSSDLSYLSCPEYILPALIHLLTNHENFEKEKEKFSNFQRILFSFFDIVLLSELENLPFFYQLIAKLKYKKDVFLDSDSTNLQVICDLSISILNKISELKTYPSQIYPGKIYIPNYFREVDSKEKYIPNNNTNYLNNEIKIDDKKARKLKDIVEEKIIKKQSPVKQSSVKKTPVKKTPVKKTPVKKTKIDEETTIQRS
jgi:hypothetical protein